MTTHTSPTDVLIIGAGPAGLSTALGLARLQIKCIVFSSNVFRNQESKHMHGVPTWEHRDPVEYRAAVREDVVKNYGSVGFEDVGIERVEKIKGGEGGEGADSKTLFRAVDERGAEWWGRKIVLAVGVWDVMLEMEGYEECWVKGIFHCLFCHGYEERGGASAGVFAIDDCAPPHFATHLARFVLRLADNATIYTNGNELVSQGIKDVLATAGAATRSRNNIFIEERKIAKLVKLPSGAEVEVWLVDGTRKIEAFIAHKPKGVLNGTFVKQMGLETTPQGVVKLSVPFNETSVSGVFAAGDCGTAIQANAIALSMGAMAAAGVASSICAED